MDVRPTEAWLRALTIGLVASCLGAFCGRIDIFLLSVPFLVWLVAGVLLRPGAKLRIRTWPNGRVSAVEGTKIQLGVSTDAKTPTILTAAWPNIEGVSFDPTYAAASYVLASQERLDIGITVPRWGNEMVPSAVVAASDVLGAWRGVGISDRVSLTLRPTSGTLHGPTGVAHPIGIAGAHTSPRRGDGSALADVRPFQPGDRLRRINWRVTSRTRQLHATSTLTDRDTEVLVLIDGMYDLSGPVIDAPTTLDVSARAAVAISHYYLTLGDRVTVTDFATRIPEIPAGTGMKQARLIADILARAERNISFSQARKRARLLPGTLVFICSPLLSEEIVTEIIRLRRLGGEVVVVDTLPPEMGEDALNYVDPDTVLAEAWQIRSLERWSTIEALRAAGIPVNPWRGPTSLGTVLLAMEAARSAPRRSLGR
ncbi:MAG: DUF58 domain-containing protein [Propionibacteriaceae bacterium]